jgi:hypothetical protein
MRATWLPPQDMRKRVADDAHPPNEGLGSDRFEPKSPRWKGPAAPFTDDDRR